MSRIVERFLDILFPPTCVGCEARGFWMCPNCLSELVLKEEASGPVGSLDGILTCGRYANPALRALVETWKYKQAWCLHDVLGEIVQRVKIEKQDPWPWAGVRHPIVVAMPSDEASIRDRGIQHTDPLVHILYHSVVFWGLRKNVLRRKRSLFKQARIENHELRKKNVRGVYEMSPYAGVLNGETCILVDDVYTSGASMQEAARVLKGYGVKKVYGFALARG